MWNVSVRWYGRMVAPSNELSFGSGHCLSHDWFEKEEGYFCPLAERCKHILESGRVSSRRRKESHADRFTYVTVLSLAR